MLTVERYRDVERILMWTRRSASLGYHVSAYVIRGILVDTGFPAMGRQFARWLATARPRAVIVTHAHEDHAGNVALVPATGAALHMATDTLTALRARGTLGLYRLFTWGRPRGVPASISIDAEPTVLRMVHTPGHSADHHIVWDAESETVFGGDLFLGVKVRAVAPWEDPRQHAASLRAVLALKPKRFFDAHRGLIMDPLGALTAKADWIEETIAAIDRRLGEGWSYEAIAREVLGAEGPIRYFSAGEYSHKNFVATVASTRDRAPRQNPPR